jgi:hypothetical protein
MTPTREERNTLDRIQDEAKRRYPNETYAHSQNRKSFIKGGKFALGPHESRIVPPAEQPEITEEMIEALEHVTTYGETTKHSYYLELQNLLSILKERKG